MKRFFARQWPGWTPIAAPTPSHGWASPASSSPPIDWLGRDESGQMPSLGLSFSTNSAWYNLDQGQLWVRAEWVELFRQWGWITCAAVMASKRADTWRTVEQRENAVLELPDAHRQKVTAYLKRHREKFYLGKIGPLDFTPLGSGPDEARSAHQCEEAGVPTFRVIAFGTHKNTRTKTVESFFLSEEVPGKPADDFWKETFGPPAPNSKDARARRVALAALARTARKLHAASLFHRDFYWCHFFVEQQDHDRCRARLIDLQRIYRSRLMHWRWRIKDLAQFVFSMPPGQLTRTEKLFWFKRYLQSPKLNLFERLLWKIIHLRAWFYQFKETKRKRR